MLKIHRTLRKFLQNASVGGLCLSSIFPPRHSLAVVRESIGIDEDFKLSRLNRVGLSRGSNMTLGCFVDDFAITIPFLFGVHSHKRYPMFLVVILAMEQNFYDNQEGLEEPASILNDSLRNT